MTTPSNEEEVFSRERFFEVLYQLLEAIYSARTNSDDEGRISSSKIFQTNTLLNEIRDFCLEKLGFTREAFNEWARTNKGNGEIVE